MSADKSNQCMLATSERQASPSSGVNYRMIETLTVENYKCFKKLRLDGLRRFNIVVGRNAGGKTALLEALFLLASANPQNVLKLRAFRGMGQEVQISNERAGFEALWRDLFHGFDQKATIKIAGTGSDSASRSLTIAYSDVANVTLPFGTQSAEPVSPTAAIDFVWTKSNGEVLPVQAALTPQGLSFGPPTPADYPAIFLTPVFRESPVENAARFSELSKTGRHRPLIDALRSEFPFIEDLSVELHARVATVHATLRSMAEKVPLPFVSDGVNKLLSILLAINAFSRGLVLIDEVENGLYFDLMGHATATMLRFAEQVKTQLFVTTHSMEYLKSLLPIVLEHPDEFCLLRTTKDNGSSDIDQFSGAHFAAALEQGFEIR
jgi:AAA15 family ATPase/GTPase